MQVTGLVVASGKWMSRFYNAKLLQGGQSKIPVDFKPITGMIIHCLMIKLLLERRELLL